MGGTGSGRFGAKKTTSDYRKLDIRRLKSEGLLLPNLAFEWQWSRHGKVFASIRMRTEENRVRLIYRHRNHGEDEWQDENYPVYLDWTACHLGSKRPWFLCPARGCDRRVALLYGGGIFACRHCYQLAYDSQRETSYDRAAHRADKIRKKLGWEPGILNGNGWKPKGMHWITYQRLTARHDAFMSESLAGMAQRLNLLGESIEDWI